MQRVFKVWSLVYPRYTIFFIASLDWLIPSHYKRQIIESSKPCFLQCVPKFGFDQIFQSQETRTHLITSLNNATAPQLHRSQLHTVHCRTRYLCRYILIPLSTSHSYTLSLSLYCTHMQVPTVSLTLFLSLQHYLLFLRGEHSPLLSLSHTQFGKNLFKSKIVSVSITLGHPLRQ